MRKVIIAVIGLLSASGAQAAWDYKEIVDPMTDVKRGIAVATGDSATVIVKCDKSGAGSLYIHILSKEYLGEGRSPYRNMKYRVDGGVPTDLKARHDGKDVLISDVGPGTPGGEFLDKIIAGSKLVLQLSSYDYDLYTSLVDISGARVAIGKAAQTCGDTDRLSSTQ